MSVMLCAHRNAHSSVVGVVNEIIIIIIMARYGLTGRRYPPLEAHADT